VRDAGTVRMQELVKLRTKSLKSYARVLKMRC